MMDEVTLFMAKIFRVENTVLFLWLGTVIVMIITFVLTHYKVSGSPETVALHYNVVIGVDVLGEKYKLYQIPLTALIIVIVNAVLNKILSPGHPYPRLVLLGASFICALTLLLAVLFLFQVN